jgi:hypothetical protein
MESFGLTPAQASELERLLEAKDWQEIRRAVRSALVPVDDARAIRIIGRFHLLDAGVERELVLELDRVEDRIALLRHAVRSPGGVSTDLLGDLHVQRSNLRLRLEQACPTVSAEFRGCPTGGIDWSMDHVPSAVAELATRLFAQVRAQARQAADDLVDSGAIALADPSTGGRKVPDFRCHPGAVDNARAFVEEMRRLTSIADSGRDRLRYEALREHHGPPSRWLARQSARRHQAQVGLEALRALHAAIAEVEVACSIAWPSAALLPARRTESSTAVSPAGSTAPWQ